MSLKINYGYKVAAAFILPARVLQMCWASGDRFALRNMEYMLLVFNTYQPVKLNVCLTEVSHYQWLVGMVIINLI